MKRVWVTVGILSLQATLSLAADLPDAVTHSDFPPLDADLALLGRDLFFDPVLSGNLNIACATCHHPSMGTSDAMSLSYGEGAVGLGPDRRPGTRNAPHSRLARNAPGLWNIGAYEFVSLFHDGRSELDADAPFGIRMPPGRVLPRPVPNLLSAQALLQVQSADEMAGHAGENAIADAVAEGSITGAGGAWGIVTARIADNPVYAARFAAFTGDRPLNITDIGRAIGEFVTHEFMAVDSPFDAWLRGDTSALDAQQIRGMELFHGKAGCASCHSGPFQTDHGYHAIGLPQIGPGTLEGTRADLGRGLVTGEEEDNYRFRTPSLRNVALTAPYGHNGAYATLEGIVRHHLDPMAALSRYDRSQAKLHPIASGADDWQALDDPEEVMRLAMAIEIEPVSLSDAEVADLLAFLGALTDPGSASGRLGVPDTVPSGLPVDH